MGLLPANGRTATPQPVWLEAQASREKRLSGAWPGPSEGRASTGGPGRPPQPLEGRHRPPPDGELVWRSTSSPWLSGQHAGPSVSPGPEPRGHCYVEPPRTAPEALSPHREGWAPRAGFPVVSAHAPCTWSELQVALVPALLVFNIHRNTTATQDCLSSRPYHLLDLSLLLPPPLEAGAEGGGSPVLPEGPRSG